MHARRQAGNHVRSLERLGRVAPQDRACESSPHTAQASHRGGSGAEPWHGATGPPPLGLLSSAAVGVYEVCPGIVPGGWLAVDGQVVRRYRRLDDLQEPAFPAFRGLGWLIGCEQVFPAPAAPAVLPG